MEVWTDAADHPLDQRWPGFAAHATVTLQATLIDRLGQRWTSAVPIAADSEGSVALAATVDQEPDALIWSMTLEPPPGRPPLPYIDACTDGLEALELELAADGQRRPMVRQLVDPRTSVTTVRGTGFAATVFSPPSASPDRCALVLGGSGGATSWSWQVAALLAAHGQRAAAVAYFDWSGQPGLARSITEIPIELVQRATTALAPHAEARIDLIGFSKGAELALIAAARLDLPLQSVCALSPSSHCWEAATTMPDAEQRSSWTHHGEPLPFLRFDAPPDFYASFDKTSLGQLHERALDRVADQHPARIAAETIRAPLLLVAGTADSTWPSARMTADIVERRPDTEHVVIDGAGHTITPPGLPANALDGRQAINARANRDMWTAARRHLASSR